MSYGTPNYRTEATMFDLYDDSASAVLAEESGNCQLDSTCVSEQFHWRCRRIQHHGGGPDPHGRLLAQGVHTAASVGGSSTWHVTGRLEYMWCTGCDGDHWMSPSFEACELRGAGKTALPSRTRWASTRGPRSRTRCRG
jgi:hypothetical protein